LQQVRDDITNLLRASDNLTQYNGTTFEKLVFDFTVKAATGSPFEGKIDQTRDAAFPDIVAAELFGVEVKVTSSDKWQSIGNSVLESSRLQSVEKIYMFFGKLGGTPEARFRNYEDCLKGIKVTHYPRYSIDMELEEGESIFHKMHTTYDDFRVLDNPVSEVKSYYRELLKDGQSLWWIDDDSEKTTALSPIIQSYSLLDNDEKNKLRAEAFIRYPVILSRSSTKFEGLAAYWASKHGLVTSNLRDHFTAGGIATIKHGSHEFTVPRIVNELLELSNVIHDLLTSTEGFELSDPIAALVSESSERERKWKYQINRESAYMELPFSLSELYEASLSR